MAYAIRFEATEDFFSAELQSAYVQGLRYTRRTGDDLLGTLMVRWEAEGKIWLLSETEVSLESQVSGA